MRKHNPIRSLFQRVSSHRTKASRTAVTSVLQTPSKSNQLSTESLQISAPIIPAGDKVMINDQKQSDETSEEQPAATRENDETSAEISVRNPAKNLSDGCEQADDQVD